MNSRILAQISGGSHEAMGLAGDNLIVDFDLSEANLPAGSELKIGEVGDPDQHDTPHGMQKVCPALRQSGAAVCE